MTPAGNKGIVTYDEVLNDVLDNGSDNSLHGATDKYFNGFGVPQGWLVVLRLNVPVNNFSVMSGRSHRFLGN